MEKIGISRADALKKLAEKSVDPQFVIEQERKAVGATLSRIVIFCVMFTEFPQTSVRLYVLTTVPEQPGSAPSETKATVTIPEQLSASPVTSFTSATGISA